VKLTATATGVTTHVGGPEVVGGVASSETEGDEVVGTVGAVIAAQPADATVTLDDAGRELLPPIAVARIAGFAHQLP
jgi:hypothetical protein